MTVNADDALTSAWTRTGLLNVRWVQRTQVSHAFPDINVISVRGRPSRKYSRKPMCTSGLARSTTMMFATEPVIVRFPGSVLDMASVSQLIQMSLMGTSPTPDVLRRVVRLQVLTMVWMAVDHSGFPVLRSSYRVSARLH